MGSSKKADNTGYNAAQGISREQLNKMNEVAETAPSEDSLKIKEFKNYQIADLLGAEDYGMSAFENVEQDPRYLQAQMKALQELQQRGAEGLTSEEREQYRQFQEDASAQEMSRQASLVQQLAQTGQGGTGLAALIASSQAAAQRQSEGGRQMGADISAARRAALEQSANVASSMSQQDMAKKQLVASARDDFSKLNTGNRQNVNMQNLENRQRVGEQNTELENQRRLQNIEGTQQAYNNRLAPLNAQSQAYNNMTNVALSKKGNLSADKGRAALGGAAAGASAGSAAGPYGAAIGAVGGGAAGYFTAEEGGIVPPKFFGGGYVRSRATQNEINVPQNTTLNNNEPLSFADMQQLDRSGIQDSSRNNSIANNNLLEQKANTAGMRPLSDDGGDLSAAQQDIAMIDAQNSADTIQKNKDASASQAQGISGGLGALSGIMGSGESAPQEAPKLIPMKDLDPVVSQSAFTKFKLPQRRGLAMADGGFSYEDGGLQHDGSGDVVPGDSYAGDRVDAKLNSAEMVLNVEQQQRLLDTIKGLKKPQELPNEDIVLQANGTKASLPPAQDDVEAKGLKKLIKMLGME